MWGIISWVAVILGIAGSWVAGKYRTGWLISAGSSLVWLAYNLDRHISAGIFASVLACFISLRNWRVGRR